MTDTFIYFFLVILEKINKLPWITEADYIINAPLVVKNMNVDVSSQSTHVRSLHYIVISHKSSFGLFLDYNNISTVLYYSVSHNSPLRNSRIIWLMIIYASALFAVDEGFTKSI